MPEIVYFQNESITYMTAKDVCSNAKNKNQYCNKYESDQQKDLSIEQIEIFILMIVLY